MVMCNLLNTRNLSEIKDNTRIKVISVCRFVNYFAVALLTDFCHLI